MNNFSVCLINHLEQTDIDVYNTLDQLKKYFNISYSVILNYNQNKYTIENIEKVLEYINIQNKIINTDINDAVKHLIDNINTDYILFLSSGTHITNSKKTNKILDEDVYLLKYKSGDHYHFLPHLIKTSYLINNQNNISYLGSKYLYISLKNNNNYHLLDNIIFSTNNYTSLVNTNNIYDNFRTVVDLISHGHNSDIMDLINNIDLNQINDDTIKFYLEYYTVGNNLSVLSKKYNRWELHLILSNLARQSRNMLECYNQGKKAYDLYQNPKPSFNTPIFNYDIYDNLVISCYYLDKYYESLFFSKKLLYNLDEKEFDRVNNNINLCLEKIKLDKNLLIINYDNITHDYLYVITQIYNTYHIKSRNHDIGDYDINDLDYLLNNYHFDYVISVNYLGYLFNTNNSKNILLITHNHPDMYLFKDVKCNFNILKLDMLLSDNSNILNYEITGNIYDINTNSTCYDLLQDNSQVIMNYKNNLDSSYDLSLMNYLDLIKNFNINLHNLKMEKYTNIVNKILDNNDNTKLDITVVIHHVGNNTDRLSKTISSLKDNYNILCFTDNNNINNILNNNIKIIHIKNLTLTKLFNYILDTCDEKYIMYVPSGTIFTKKLNINLSSDFIRLNKNIPVSNFCNPMIINLDELRRYGYFINSLKNYTDYFNNQEFCYNKIDTYYLQDPIDISYNYNVDGNNTINIIIRNNQEFSNYKNIFKSHDFNINHIDLDERLYVTDRLKHLFWYNDYNYRVEQMSYYIKNIEIWSKNKDYEIVIFNEITKVSPDIEYELSKIFEYNDKDATIIQLNDSKLEYSYYLNKKASQVLSIISNSSGIKTSFLNFIKNIPGLKYLVINIFEHKELDDQITQLSGYNFYSNLDSYHYDILHVENKTVQELKELCDSDDRYLGFNTLGWIKYHILPVESLNILYGSKNHHDGLYVKDITAKLKNIKDDIVERLKNRSDNLLTFTITTCKRLEKFIATMNNFLIKCKDLDIIDRFICIDDNSSDDDRDIMKREYPFFEFILKNKEEKGHAKSMNILFDKIKSPYVIHFEDDWLSYEPFCIKPYFDIIKSKKLDQIMLRKNCWADHEFLEKVQDNKIVYRHVYNHDHVIKPQINREYDLNHTDIKTNYGNSDKYWWWPGFTLNPSIFYIDILKEKVGYFKEDIIPELFEYEYALRAYKINYQVGYVNLQINHIGNDVSSYTLNNTKRYYDK
jgi:hypothetical protein